MTKKIITLIEKEKRAEEAENGSKKGKEEYFPGGERGDDPKD